MTGEVVTAAPERTVREIAELMRERNVGSVVLVAGRQARRVRHRPRPRAFGDRRRARLRRPRRRPRVLAGDHRGARDGRRGGRRADGPPRHPAARGGRRGAPDGHRHARRSRAPAPATRGWLRSCRRASRAPRCPTSSSTSAAAAEPRGRRPLCCLWLAALPLRGTTPRGVESWRSRLPVWPWPPPSTPICPPRTPSPSAASLPARRCSWWGRPRSCWSRSSCSRPPSPTSPRRGSG